jgi:hypothetical protein
VPFNERLNLARFGYAGAGDRCRQAVENVPGQRIGDARRQTPDVEAGDETRQGLRTAHRGSGV